MMDSRTSISGEADGRARSAGIVAFGIFLFFGATMAALAGITLIWQGTILDGIWKLNPTAYQQLAILGRSVGIAFLFLGGLMVVAGIAWFRRSRWGWRLAVAIVAVQFLGDLLNALRGDFIRGGIGTIIAGALLLYLFSAKVKKTFAGGQGLDR
ncbi:MAG TPA: hypothetical protein VHS34_01385 [Terriglobales bacterium]|jgi:hypothetical protein|nr:hypothetical protein [Terriglobales bacterium]